MLLPATGYVGLLGSSKPARQSTATTTLIVNNTTGSVTMFTLTGSVLVHGLWGEVTTVLSSNVTAAFLEMNDQTLTEDITLAAGTTLSSAPVGSILVKEGLTAAAITLKSNAAGFFEEPATAGIPSFSPFIVGKKTGAVTILRLTYSTTNTPSSGAILWTAVWTPLSTDGNLA